MKSLLFAIPFFLLVVMTNAQSSKVFPDKLVMALNHPYSLYSAQSPWFGFFQYSNYVNKDIGVHTTEATYLPLISEIANPLYIDDAVKFEMLSAQASGVDGFQFVIRYIPFGDLKVLSRIIEAYHRVANEENIDFKFSLFLDFHHPASVKQDQMMNMMKMQLKYALENTTYSPKWLRSERGEIITLTGNTESIIDELNISNVSYGTIQAKIENDLSYVDTVDSALVSIEKFVNEPLEYIYQTRFPRSKNYINKVLSKYAGIWNIHVNNSAVDEIIPSLAKKHNKPYVQFLSAQESQFMYRKNKPHGLVISANKQTGTFRGELQNAVNFDAQMISLNSWNDLKKGNFIAPELNHGFGFNVLLKHYKDQWKNNEMSKDEILLLAYNTTKTTTEVKSQLDLIITERHAKKEDMDKVEIVTYLTSEGDVYCNEQFVGKAPKGMNSFYLDIPNGGVTAEVKRENKAVYVVTGKTPIRDKAYRYNFLINTYTNQDQKFLDQIIDLAVDPVVRQNTMRFLLTQKQQQAYKEAVRTKVMENINTLKEHQITSSSLSQKRAKTNKKYKKEIARILGSQNYSIWEEIEMEAEELSRRRHASYKEGEVKGQLLQPFEF
ncbi:hypothetical protein [Flammeovirga sp. EKP202]|uniref:hypothetical protein n=1 Tax=Flammeovirga sp. EKP202 TaxID=2770592 RepID=UPI00165ED9D5|nr:hypothetical protein [Flammeovirga sp. EKP202]MBD0400263.1 hypothetical protein [Flammeovirga sp. EKP202]